MYQSQQNPRSQLLQISKCNQEKQKSKWYLRNAEGIKNCKEVIVKVKEGGLLGLWRRVGESISAVVRSDGPESGVGQSDHLVAPRVPYFREAV